MTTLTISPYIWHGFAKILTFIAKSHSTQKPAKRSAEDRRAEQDLVKELMWSNQQAFLSEQDAHYMLLGFYGRY